MTVPTPVRRPRRTRFYVRSKPQVCRSCHGPIYILWRQLPDRKRRDLVVLDAETFGPDAGEYTIDRAQRLATYVPAEERDPDERYRRKHGPHCTAAVAS